MTENSAAHDGLPDHLRSDQQIRLGRQIRKLRHREGLTLVGLAALTNLSHPFLSQVERGLATPSMASLERISTALGSSRSQLMARAAEVEPELGNRPTVVRATEGTVVTAAGGTARLLILGRTAFHPMLYVGDNSRFEEFDQNPEDEFLHVIEGAVEVDLDEQGTAGLAAGDSLYYPGGCRRRWRSLSGRPYRVLAVKDAGAGTP